MKVKITNFGKRHFDKTFGGTKILDVSVEEFEKHLDSLIDEDAIYEKDGMAYMCNIKEMPGYAPFCKLLAIKNFTDARVGSMPITLENYQFIRSGYSARRDSELPVFSRWLELPLGKPKAEYLLLVLYDREQLKKEATDKEPFEFENDKDVEWGIVAILGQSHPNEEPMKPETMMRNALGISEGGSGVQIDRDAYMKSVEFWDKNITVK